MGNALLGPGSALPSYSLLHDPVLRNTTMFKATYRSATGGALPPCEVAAAHALASSPFRGSARGWLAAATGIGAKPCSSAAGLALESGSRALASAAFVSAVDAAAGPACCAA